MERVYYIPPKGTPPFAFSYSGSGRVFMPPDQWWKKEIQEYPVGIILHPTTGEPKRDPKNPSEFLTLKHRKKVWVVDTERNEMVKQSKALPPENYLDLTHDELVFLNTGDFREYTRWLKRETDVLRTNRSKIHELQRQGELEIAQLQDRIRLAKEKLEREAVDYEAEVEKMLRLQAEVRTDAPAPAPVPAAQPKLAVPAKPKA